MLNNRERQDLDNYITGHYGEDQFKGMDEDEEKLKAKMMEDTEMCVRCEKKLGEYETSDGEYICIDCYTDDIDHAYEDGRERGLDA